MLYHNQDYNMDFVKYICITIKITYIYTSRNLSCITTKITFTLHEIHVVSQSRLQHGFREVYMYHNQDYIYIYFTKSILYHNQDYIYTSRNPSCITTKITYTLHEIHVVSQSRLQHGFREVYMYHNQDYIYIYFTKSILYHNQDYIYTSPNPCCITIKITTWIS